LEFVIGFLDKLKLFKLNLLTHLEIIKNSYTLLTRRELPLSLDASLIGAFDKCPFPIASHDNSSEPLFKRTLNEMMGLPSRASALPVDQDERSKILEQVTQYGFIEHYQGKRVASDQSIFYIQDATVWNLLDIEKKYYGQAVIIFKTSN
jgi:hypothetical protein